MSGCAAREAALVEVARGRDDPEVRGHVAACPACAARLSDEETLTRALRTLAAEDGARGTPPQVERRLRAALRALGAKTVPVTARRWPMRLALAGLAAGALAAAALALLKQPAPIARPAATTSHAREETEFLPLVYGEPLEGADALHLTRVRVPRSALASFGWPDPLDDGPPVEAEVLIGQDGLARGIRFVSDEGGPRP